MCNHERCQHPIECEKKRKTHSAQNEKAIEEFGQHEFMKLQKIFSTKGIGCLKTSIHADRRSFERSFSKTVIYTVLMEGDIIEYYQNRYVKKMLLWGNTYISKGNYRPQHIVLKKRAGETKWSIVTIYDPRTKPWRWNKSFTERVCFCE